MRKLTVILISLLACLCVVPASAAKKYKWTYGDHALQVYTTGQGKNRTQLVKAWAVAKNADKAIEQAKMDAVSAACSPVSASMKRPTEWVSQTCNPL